MKNTKAKTVIIVVLIILLIGILGYMVWMNYQYKNETAKLKQEIERKNTSIEQIKKDNETINNQEEESKEEESKQIEEILKNDKNAQKVTLNGKTHCVSYSYSGETINILFDGKIIAKDNKYDLNIETPKYHVIIDKNNKQYLMYEIALVYPSGYDYYFYFIGDDGKYLGKINENHLTGVGTKDGKTLEFEILENGLNYREIIWKDRVEDAEIYYKQAYIENDVLKTKILKKYSEKEVIMAGAVM